MDHDSTASEPLDERRRIIDAAWQVLGRSGFQGLKVGSVVRAVPTSTRAFYRWFADKDDLVVELVCEEYQHAGRRLAAISQLTHRTRQGVSEVRPVERDHGDVADTLEQCVRLVDRSVVNRHAWSSSVQFSGIGMEVRAKLPPSHDAITMPDM